MIRESGKVWLQKADVQRINALTSGGVDLAAFEQWYQLLVIDEQAELVGELCQFAYQYGVDDTVYREAASMAGFDENRSLICSLHQVRAHRSGALNIGGLKEWLRNTDDDTRRGAMFLFACLLGCARRRVTSNRQKD